MKSELKKLALALGVVACFTLTFSNSNAQTEMCKGSGVHCADLDYNGIKVKLVKGKDEPGVVIKE